MTSLVFSEHWDSFRLDDFETDLMGLAWEIELAGSERLAKLPHALSGKVLRVTLPAGMPAGDFSYDLRFKAYPQGAHAGDEPLSSSMKVHGSVLSRLSVRGPHMSGGREIRFGPVAEGAGLAERYLVKVRGEEQELALARYASRPDFIKAELAPYRSEVDGETKPGLYRLTLSIPKDAPPCTHPPTKPATVRLYFDHPGIEMYELTLTFSIIAKD